MLHDLSKVDHIANMLETWSELLPFLSKLVCTIHKIVGVHQRFFDHVWDLMSKQNIFVLFLQWFVAVDVVKGKHDELFNSYKLHLKRQVQVPDSCIKT